MEAKLGKIQEHKWIVNNIFMKRNRLLYFQMMDNTQYVGTQTCIFLLQPYVGKSQKIGLKLDCNLDILTKNDDILVLFSSEV